MKISATRPLTQDAADFCVAYAENWRDAGMVPVTAWLWEDKYAELIIRECISIFDGTKEIPTIGLFKPETIVRMIKSHFELT